MRLISCVELLVRNSFKNRKSRKSHYQCYHHLKVLLIKHDVVLRGQLIHPRGYFLVTTDK